MRLRGESGFSLVELILVLTILSVIAVGFARYFREAIDGWAWTSAQARQSTVTRLALDRIVRELAELSDPGGLGALTPTTITIPAPGGIQHVLEWSGIPGDSLLFSNDETTVPLCLNVDSLGFSYFDAAGAVTTTAADVRRVSVALRVGTAAHATLYRTMVYVRNR